MRGNGWQDSWQKPMPATALRAQISGLENEAQGRSPASSASVSQSWVQRLMVLPPASVSAPMQR